MSKEILYKKSEFPLFNDEALKNSNEIGIKSSTIDHNGFSRYNDGQFNQKINLDQNTDIIRKKRGRKSKVENKDFEASNVTLKEIIENQKGGIPTEKEKKMKEERMKKMHEKRNEKKANKNNDIAFMLPGSDEKSLIEEISPEKKILSKELSSPNENIRSNEKTLKIINGKLQISLANEFSNENNQITAIVGNKPEKTTSMSFRPRNHTEKWSQEDTKKFFRALEFFGSDFSVIAKFFPMRNRAQIKNKYRKEERENPESIDRAFKRHKLSGKQKFKDRLAEINNMIENPATTDSIEYPEKTEELKKNMSNSSTDSTDRKIIDDLINICRSEEKEIRAKDKSMILKDLNTPNSINSNKTCEKSQESLTSYNLLSNL